jgi:hypothetical protein
MMTTDQSPRDASKWGAGRLFKIDRTAAFCRELRWPFPDKLAGAVVERGLLDGRDHHLDHHQELGLVNQSANRDALFGRAQPPSNSGLSAMAAARARPNEPVDSVGRIEKFD